MKKIIALFGFIAVLIACSSSDNEGEVANNNYDRTTLLTNWADNIIIPAYENYQSKVNTLSAEAAAFTALPTVLNLQTLRVSWLEAYKAYQYVALYNFGKAQDISFKEITNTYPANIVGIDENIATGTYNLTLFPQYARQGFPGLDYLINGLGANDTEIAALYATANHKNYLSAVVAKMKSNADAIVADWNGGYRESYISNNGTSVSSSVSKTTNSFVKSFERDIRSGKVGFPAGMFSEAPRPTDVEAYYKKDVSKVLLATSVAAAKEFFNGKYFNASGSGEGLKSYLDYVNAVRDGQKLSDIINTQFALVETTNNLLNDNFITQINTDNQKMINAYTTMQQNLIYLKLDMMQALNITIDYVDGDGD